tara:strand:+ start:1875 stop:2708 length:834 start_codon:yes stop_codon:yes gene_type:complete
MANLIVKSPIRISGSTGVTTSHDDSKFIYLQEAESITLSIGQAVESSSNVTFNSFTTENPLELKTKSISGSANGTASFGGDTHITGSLSVTGDTTIDGNLTITGSIVAEVIRSELTQSFQIQRSGSTLFGNTLDDKHEFTGSLALTGSLSINSSTAIDEIANSAVANDASDLATERAARLSFNTSIAQNEYLRKSFTHTASISTTTASFAAVTASTDTMTSTSKDDFMFFINGMIMEYDALNIQQKGSTLELHVNTSNLGYNLSSDDEIVGFGKFNS